MSEVTYYVWVNTITDVYTESLVGRLVRRGWRVAPLASSLSLHNEDNMSTLIAFTIARTPKNAEDEVTAPKVLEEVKDVLKRLKMRYHSVIVTQPVGCTWVLGNITQSETKKLEEERKKATN